MRQTLDTIATLMNTEVTFVTDPARLRPANSEVFRLCGSTERLQRCTGWVPARALPDGLARTVQWFRDADHLARYKADLYNV